MRMTYGECWLKKSHSNPSISSIKEHKIVSFLQASLNKIQSIKCLLQRDYAVIASKSQGFSAIY